MGRSIIVKDLRVSIQAQRILDGVTFTSEGGAITALFGPNGSGKSTLLNVLSGLLPAESGSYDIEHDDAFGLSYVFQNYRDSLLPWRSNWRNISLPLEIQHVDKATTSKRVAEVYASLGFSLDLQRYPYELSGGQQQVVAFLRALVTQPNILFVDEPFSALDYETNLRFRLTLQEYWARQRPTVLLVSHNIEEAVHLASRIVVLSRRPTSVVQIIENPLHYPRPLEVLTTESFYSVRDQVLQAFKVATQL
jgi:NitT/TauT family transport system ATP-binding protein